MRALRLALLRSVLGMAVALASLPSTEGAESKEKSGHIQGPAPTNQASYKGEGLQQVVDFARSSAGVVISGTDVVFDGGQTIGSPSDYQVVYMDADQVDHLQFSGRFQGYGTLVIEGADIDREVLRMSGESAWHGLIILVANADYSADGVSPIAMVGGGSGTHIIGGLVTYLAGATASWTNGGTAFNSTGVSKIRYSAGAIQAALNSSLDRWKVVSYRVIR